MAHKTLKDRLDQLDYEDLSIPFDEGLVWERLEARLESKKKGFLIKWLIAASILLSIVSVPLIFQHAEPDQVVASSDTKMETVTTLQKADENQEKDERVDWVTSEETLKEMKRHPIIQTLTSKGIEVNIADVVLTPNLVKMPIKKNQKESKPQFAAEDISIIQATLENATVNDRRMEKEKSLSIRAQWQTFSSDQTNIESNQPLKIKLYEKN